MAKGVELVSLVEKDVPLQDCSDCAHVSVCKFVVVFAKWKAEKSVPLDFSTASCLAYLSNEIIDAYIESEDGDPNDEPDCDPSSMDSQEGCSCGCGMPASFYTSDLLGDYQVSPGYPHASGVSIHNNVLGVLEGLVTVGKVPTEVRMSFASMKALAREIGYLGAEPIGMLVTNLGSYPVTLDSTLPFGQVDIVFTTK